MLAKSWPRILLDTGSRQRFTAIYLPWISPSVRPRHHRTSALHSRSLPPSTCHRPPQDTAANLGHANGDAVGASAHALLGTVEKLAADNLRLSQELSRERAEKQDLQQRLQTEVAVAEAAAGEVAAMSAVHAQELRVLQEQHDAEVAKLTARLQQLEDKVTTSQSRSGQLQSQLEQSHAQVSAVKADLAVTRQASEARAAAAGRERPAGRPVTPTRPNAKPSESTGIRAPAVGYLHSSPRVTRPDSPARQRLRVHAVMEGEASAPMSPRSAQLETFPDTGKLSRDALVQEMLQERATADELRAHMAALQREFLALMQSAGPAMVASAAARAENAASLREKQATAGRVALRGSGHTGSAAAISAAAAATAPSIALPADALADVRQEIARGSQRARTAGNPHVLQHAVQTAMHMAPLAAVAAAAAHSASAQHAALFPPRAFGGAGRPSSPSRGGASSPSSPTGTSSSDAAQAALVPRRMQVLRCMLAQSQAIIQALTAELCKAVQSQDGVAKAAASRAASRASPPRSVTISPAPPGRGGPGADRSRSPAPSKAPAMRIVRTGEPSKTIVTACKRAQVHPGKWDAEHRALERYARELEEGNVELLEGLASVRGTVDKLKTVVITKLKATQGGAPAAPPAGLPAPPRPS